MRNFQEQEVSSSRYWPQGYERRQKRKPVTRFTEEPPLLTGQDDQIGIQIFRRTPMQAQETTLFVILSALLFVNLAVPYMYQRRAVTLRSRR